LGSSPLAVVTQSKTKAHIATPTAPARILAESKCTCRLEDIEVLTLNAEHSRWDELVSATKKCGQAHPE
jgi:hypothetical protein